MTTLETLTQAVESARNALTQAEKDLVEFKSKPENNVFKDLDEASFMLYERLRYRAHADCEGSGKYGYEQYSQECIVGGVHYMAIGKFVYGRYDKMYYYVDEYEFTIEPL